MDMDQEHITKSWNEYLKRESESPLVESHLFKYPYCGTCKFWTLIDEDGLAAIQDQQEYDKVIQGIEGNILRAVRDNGSVIDTYTTWLFFGFCKRYPPQSPRPIHIADYDFPLLSHWNTCGEWIAAKNEPDAK